MRPACWRARPRGRELPHACLSAFVAGRSERLFRRDAETSTRAACATLLARGSDGLGLRVRGFEAKNCFAFFHQIKPVASDRFEVAHVCLEQGDLAGLARQQILLLANLLLQGVDLRAA